MSVLELSSILAAVVLVAAPLLVRIPASARPAGPTLVRIQFLRFALLAAASGAVAGVSLAMSATAASGPLFALTNAALVGGPAYFWAGMRQLRHPSMTPGWTAAVAVGVTYVLSLSATLVPLPEGADGTLLRLALVMIGCGAAAAESFRRPAREVKGFLLAGTLFAIYAGYSLVRLTAWLAVGPSSSLYQEWFSVLAAAILSIPLVVGLCIAIWWSDRTLAARADELEATARTIREELSAVGALTVYEITIPDLALIRVAFGSAAADAVDAAAAQSLRGSAPAGHRYDQPGRHLLALPGDVTIAEIGADAARAASHAVPTLDYREAIEVRTQRHLITSEDALEGLWPDVAPAARARQDVVDAWVRGRSSAG